MGFHGESFVQGRDILAWDPINGWMIQRPWHGTPTQMAALRTNFTLQGVKWEDGPRIDGGYESVFAFYGASETQPATEELSNAWELIGNDLEKDIWTHPKVTAMFNAYLDNEGFPSDEYAQNKTDIDRIVAGEIVPSEARFWSGAFPQTKQFVRSLLRGVTHYSVSQYVLRNTKIVANNYNVKPEIARVGKILTTAQVSSIYAVPSTIRFVMPEGFWHERTPTVQQTTATKWTITREWWHADEYDDFLYDAATS